MLKTIITVYSGNQIKSVRKMPISLAITLVTYTNTSPIKGSVTNSIAIEPYLKVKTGE
jgi:hypothetical protein